MRTKKPKPKVSLFLDSGAFSAWSQKAHIDIDEYIAFIKQHEDVLEIYANLDVIGDPVATWENQRIMEAAGLKPMPVYHSEDPVRYLHQCLDNYDFFAIGGMAKGFTQSQRQQFLDRSWGIVCNTPDKLPRAKIHGFGMTSFKLMRRYPWYSVDSTSWVMTSRTGAIFVPPPKRDGSWNYHADPIKVALSSQSPAQKDVGRHFRSMKPAEQEIVRRYLTEKGYPIGESEFYKKPIRAKLAENERWGEKIANAKNGERLVERVIELGASNNYIMRDELNILYFLDFEKHQPEWPWPFKIRMGFGI